MKQVTLNWLQSHSIRLIIRLTFLTLIAATLLISLIAIRESIKQFYIQYNQAFSMKKLIIINHLESEAGQLAIANPERFKSFDGKNYLRPVMIPYGAIQADDPKKINDMLEYLGCSIFLDSKNSICFSSSKTIDKTMNRLYIVGKFHANDIKAYDPKLKNKLNQKFTKILESQRIELEIKIKDQTYAWILPVQRIDNEQYTLTPYAMSNEKIFGKPDFTLGSWISILPNSNGTNQFYYSIQIPWCTFSKIEKLCFKKDISRFNDKIPNNVVLLNIKIKDHNNSIFDSEISNKLFYKVDSNSLKSILRPGDKLTVTENNSKKILLKFFTKKEHIIKNQYFYRKIMSIIYSTIPENLKNTTKKDNIIFHNEKYEVFYSTDPFEEMIASRHYNINLISKCTALLLISIVFSWLVIEFSVLRRIINLSKRTSEVSLAVRGDNDFLKFNFKELRGRDEIGVLANGIDDLLNKISVALQAEAIRIAHEKDILHAIGHEIRSPLQSLVALNELSGDNEMRRYIRRMLRAVDSIYGQSSPSEGISNYSTEEEVIDLSNFLKLIAENAIYCQIENVNYQGVFEPLMIKVDPIGIEEAISHILNNAQRYTKKENRFDPSSPPQINISLESTPELAIISIFNNGPHIPEELIDRVFEYGVSDQLSEQMDSHNSMNRGQGLFACKAHLSKIGGDITVKNVKGGVTFIITLLRGR